MVGGFEQPVMDPNRIITDNNPMFYIILNVSELNKVNFDELFNNVGEELRYSVDGTKTFLKFRGNVPLCFQNLQTKSEVLSSDEINDILHTEEWNF